MTISVVVPAATSAQDAGYRDPESYPRPVVEAREAGGPIRLDARLDEPAWQHAVPITEFVQSQPIAGAPPTEPTVVRILYDDRNLYVGALCYDSEPEKIVITTLEYDLGTNGASSRDMDIFSISLDTFHDRRNSFLFLVSPGGAFRDGQTFNDSRQIDFAWRGVATVKTAVHDSGYTVEMAIPWTTLRFDPSRSDQEWGLNILRRIRRKSEDVYWAPLDRRDPVHRMSKAGTLVGLHGLRSGRNLQFRPYGLAATVAGSNYSPNDDGFDWDAGGEVKWGVTSDLTLDGTVRTDFSQVEVDQEQVNLTRFPLFFPERRDFFVENSGSFLLGDVTERGYRSGSSLRDFTLFHSRRIGLVGGRPIPILGGGRLTGRAGGFEVGFLDIQTESTASTPAENFAVARVRRNIGPGDVGAMVVNRQATGDGSGPYNRSYGLDANFHFFRYLAVNTYVARTDGDDASGDQTAARVAVGWRDQFWDVSAFAKHVGDGFDPQVGFVRRPGVRQGYVTAGVHPRPALAAIQELNPYGELHYVTDLDGELLTRVGSAAIGVQFQDGATLNLAYENRFEFLPVDDVISGETVAAGRYTTDEISATFQSSRARPLSANLRASRGGFFDGRRTSLSARASWRLHYRFSVDATLSRNEVELGGRSFSADVYGGRIRIARSTALFANALVQYNTQSDQLISNFRVNWVYAPLSEVFLVFTERRNLRADPAAGTVKGVTERSLTFKVTRLLAF